MKIKELNKTQLQTLKAWKNSKEYKIIFDLARNKKNSDATMLRKDIMASENEWDAIKGSIKRAYIGVGMEEILRLPDLADKRLELLKKEEKKK